jgi:hypothetical protein
MKLVLLVNDATLTEKQSLNVLLNAVPEATYKTYETDLKQVSNRIDELKGEIKYS